MSGFAQVRSVDAIVRFRASLADFEKQVQRALDSLGFELQRVVDWLDHDRPAYWKLEAKRAADAVHLAKMDLERCLIFPVAGEQPACREERAALRKAQQREEYCREKREAVKRWQRELHHEMFEYQGRIAHLRRILETELPAARGFLKQIVDRLDAYQVEQPPEPSEKVERLSRKPTEEES